MQVHIGTHTFKLYALVPAHVFLLALSIIPVLFSAKLYGKIHKASERTSAYENHYINMRTITPLSHVAAKTRVGE